MLTKGKLVTYEVSGMVVEAIIRTMHRDGSVTVEARHELCDGKPRGCYMGYRYRMAREDLKLAS